MGRLVIFSLMFYAIWKVEYEGRSRIKPIAGGMEVALQIVGGQGCTMQSKTMPAFSGCKTMRKNTCDIFLLDAAPIVLYRNQHAFLTAE